MMDASTATCFPGWRLMMKRFNLGLGRDGFGWKGNGPEWSRRQKVVFFFKSIFPSIFKLYFADLKFIGGFKLF
jgi:hypothetical protein